MPARLKLGAVLMVLLFGSAAAAPSGGNAVTAVRYWTLGDVTRIVVQTTNDFEYRRDRVPNPDRLFFDLSETWVRLGKKGISTFPVHDSRLKRIRIAETSPGIARVVFDLEDAVEYTASLLSNPPRLIVELRQNPVAAKAKLPEPVLFVPDPLLTFSIASPAPELAVLPSTATVSARIPAPARTVRSTRAGVKSAKVDTKAAAEAAALAAVSTSPESAVVPPATRVGTPPERAESILAESPPRGSNVDSKPGTIPGSGTAVAVAATSKRATAGGQPKPARLGASQSMTRVLGLKVGRIVLDAGHGGHDTGTAGPGGLLEKDLVLDVCQRLGKLIETRLGAEVVHTRSDDTFVPLERRTELANELKADLFLSVHANSSPASTSSGIETYYLNFTTSQEALRVAARENASSQKTVYELKDLLQKIAMQDKVDESRQFAARIQQSLYSASVKANSRTRDRGVRKAPFVVLIGASMPSVLAEIGFISNPKDADLFRKPDFRQKIAEGLYEGISRYAATLSQFHVAKN